MDFQTAVRTCLSKYLMLSGRAARPEYWWFYLFTIIAAALASIVDGLVFGFAVEDEVGKHPFTMVVSFALFFPLLAAGWRRMHDTNRPGWLMLLPAILVLAGLVTFLITVGIAGLFGHVMDAGPDAMEQTDRFAGIALLVVFYIAILAAALMKLWWLTRPGDDGQNAYGPPPPR